ncbi:hypothetical protein ACQEVZ_55530 [Dactylosporangium sp. CA-152071]|uniref:hypothetical protein n=1 Tax=Dactylosporangium sp. CA-152071 TaxID=3239933 RepID=UPI003D91E7F9
MIGAQTTAQRWFRSGSASPEFQVPHLADFYTWTVEQHQPLTVASYLRYAADHPGSLPDDESADLGRVPGDLSYLYRLTLDGDQHGLHLEVYDLSTRPLGRGGRLGRPVESLTQADLYEAAARWCDTVAARCERYADTNAGIPMPGGEPQIWLDRAAGYRQRHTSTPIHAVAVNLAAAFHPATFDVVQPSIQVAGVWVFAFINPDGVLQVSVHLDETELWLLSPASTVPIRVTVQGTDVFTADA